MARGGSRRGAGRKAKDQPGEPLYTYSFTVRLADVGVLNRVGNGNLSLGLRRLVDLACQHQFPGTMHPRLMVDDNGALIVPAAPAPQEGGA
jgi:hypothetical protein